jgi:esterase/lipase
VLGQPSSLNATNCAVKQTLAVIGPSFGGLLTQILAELVPQQAMFAPCRRRTAQWQLPVPESWKEPPCAARKRQV